jgi:hypothetical protein
MNVCRRGSNSNLGSRIQRGTAGGSKLRLPIGITNRTHEGAFDNINVAVLYIANEH